MTGNNWRLQNLLISMMYRSVHLRPDHRGDLSPPFPGCYLQAKVRRRMFGLEETHQCIMGQQL